MKKSILSLFVGFIGILSYAQSVETYAGIANDDPTNNYESTSNKELNRKSTRLNSSHDQISYAVFCLKKKKKQKKKKKKTQYTQNTPEINMSATPLS